MEMPDAAENQFFRLAGGLADCLTGLTRNARRMASSKSMSNFNPPVCFCGFVFTLPDISLAFPLSR